MFDGLIVGCLARVIAESVSMQNLTEIRMRLGRRLLLLTASGERIYPRLAGRTYTVSQDDINGIISRATDMSPYSVSDEMIKGYIPCKTVRIGVGGEGVSDGGKLLNVKNISYLVIRVPHQIKSAADGVIDSVLQDKSNVEQEYATSDVKNGESAVTRHKRSKEVNNTLIISPPGGGKTTVLRELARLLSAHKNVVVIDERYELAAVSDGVPTLDIGDADVVSGVPKAIAYENCIRAMNPDVIVTDELFRHSEVTAICDVLRSGVKVIASVHGDSVEALTKTTEYAPLIDKFDIAVVLGKNPVGSIREIVRL
ncbi:MAG: Flp pilus assembly complex ATPase component TadA [Clostridia bacterium]|nr:Flp pilus assembly complex ATPase component TadA [Clostridia bacterium]